ncbi:MAG: DUF4430 domain-containing protein [Faecalibacterium sp.]|nr:DUF4430 domain-containing protein [Faecalibacterium sp.]
MKKMNFNRISALVAAALAAVCLMVGCGSASSAQPASKPASSVSAQQQITATLKITDKDGAVTEMALNTTAGATLAQALADAGVISKEEADSGFVTVVNGIATDYNADKSWWGLVDAEGQMTPVGISDITLNAGDVYGFVYNIG